MTSAGSDGDFNPLLAIAAALVRRGVTVTVVTNPFYESRVVRAGCRFVGAGRFFDVFAALEADPRYLDPRRGLVAVWKDLVVPIVRETYPRVLETIGERGAAAVVSHFLSYGGAWAAAQSGARSVLVATAPAAWPSPHRPTVFANWRAPRVVQAALTVAGRIVSGVVLRGALRRLARELGAPVVDVARTADLNLGAWPEWFRAPVPDDPPRARACGFVFDPAGASASLPRDVEAFLAAGDPPVVAAFGSAASLRAAARYRAVADACGALGRRCLLIGRSAATLATAPNVLTVAAAPYARVFPAASVVVHHGGLGTCAEALRAGKPSLVTPFAFDQFDTAARLDDAPRLAQGVRRREEGDHATLATVGEEDVESVVNG